MARICDQLEQTYNYFAFNDQGATGCEWLPLHGTAQILQEELGYEDIAEFEDALKGSFNDFLDILPHVEKKEENGKIYLKVKQDPPVEEWTKKTLVFKITSTQDLWRVCYKGINGKIEIPELEFEVSPDGKRHIDSIYNHIAAAIHNLGTHVRSNPGMQNEVSIKIMETCYMLNMLLDAPKPWHFIIHDLSGVSEIHPQDESVQVIETEKLPEFYKSVERWVLSDNVKDDLVNGTSHGYEYTTAQ